MKNKIVKLQNGVSYYLLEEIIYLDKHYVYGIPCDLEKDELYESMAVILEVMKKQEDIIFQEISDDNITLEVLKQFQKKFQE